MKPIFALAAGAALFVSACNKKEEVRTQPAAPEAKLAAAPGVEPAFAAPDTFKAALGKVVEGYSSIQGALAQDDLAGAKEAFSTMHAVLHMMPKEGLDDSAKTYWESTDTRIMDILHPMASAATLESARAYFMDFTPVLVDAIEKFGISGDRPLYLFHCPMARDNKGADWLQTDSGPANPYFGKSMLTCGQRTRTIKG